MNEITRPMLAKAVKDNDFTTIDYPILVSPKLYGIRCIRPHGKDPMTRGFKPIPNRFIMKTLIQILPEGFDGEIILPNYTFNQIQSEVMSHDGKPNFIFNAFDYVQESLLEFFESRIKECHNAVSVIGSKYLTAVEHHMVYNAQELKLMEDLFLSQGYEGVMIRKPNGRYKCGRSTVNEGLLLKLKRFSEDEGVIIGFESMLHNNNPKEINELGLTKRSTCKENMIKMDTLGKFVLSWENEVLKVGGGDGLTQKLRKHYWNNRQSLLGKKLTFYYQKHGTKNKPRSPKFKGIREDI